MRNLKRALSLALASVMVIGMMVVGTSAASYKDVDAQDNLEAIEVLKAVGVMTGDENGNFNPDKMVTRNEMAVVMTNLLGLKAGGSHPFKDVPTWAAPYVAACYNNNIIAGVSATEFNGDANVTAVQAGLMVMKALGYFGYQGEFGDSWKLAVVKQANEIDLYAGINAYTDQDMTRNEIAKMVMNALETEVMVVREIGGIQVDGNGITVTEKPRYSYTYADNKSGKHYEVGESDAIMQLCEKLYGNDLKKDGAAFDDFDRPATKWTYKDDSIVSPKAADLTYTKEVKCSDIYKDLGKPATITAVNYSVDGNVKDTVAIAGTSTDKVGGNGTLTEVYFNKDTKVATIVSINTYYGEVTKFTPAKGDDKAAVTVDGLKFETEAFELEDKVLYTKAEGKIKTMVLAEVADAGKVTGLNVKKDTFILNGTTYEKAANIESDTIAVKAELDVYVDAYGYVIHTETTKDAEAQYAVVLGTKQDGFSDAETTYAKIVLADGTIAEVEYKLADEIKGTNLETNNLVGYTVKDGVYTFKTATAGTAVTKVTNGAADLGSAKANSKTVFVVRTGTPGDYEYTAYTGIAAVPSMEAGLTATALVDKGIAKMVYITNATEAGSEADLPVYILNASKTEMVDEDNETYYVYNAVVDGEATTVEATSDKLDGLYKSVSYNADGQIVTAVKVDSDKQGTATGTNKVKDGLVTLGTEQYSFSEDVQVFVVDSDNEIAETTIGSIGEDANDTVLFSMDKYGIVTTIIITEVTGG